MELTIEIHQEEGKYWGQVREMPGCFGTGDTLDELYESIQEAVEVCKDDYPELFNPNAPVGTSVNTMSVGIAA